MVIGLSTLLVMAQTSVPKIDFKDGVFVVSGARGTEKVPIAGTKPVSGPLDAKLTRFRYASEGKTVWFDKNGIAYSQKGFRWRSTLRAVPTSGKVATKESNEELVRLLKEGQRKLDVSALSGWAVVDKQVYLLARWDDASKRPWLEALVSIDLSQKRPEPKLAAKWPGLSFATGVVDSALVTKDGALASLANGPENFGRAEFHIQSGETMFEPLGPRVSKARFVPGTQTVWTLTPTSYGTNLLGLVNVGANSLRTVAEVRGKMKGVVNPAVAQYVGVDGPRWLNLHTGAETAGTMDSQAWGTSNGILVWSPSHDPKSADLFDGSFRKLATWKWSPTVTKTTSGKAASTSPKPPSARTAAPSVKPITAKKTVKPKSKPKRPVIQVTSQPKSGGRR